MAGPAASQKVNGHIAVSSAFLLLALAGWGGFAYSARSAAQQRATLAAEVQRFRSEQDELRAERDRARAAQRDASQQLADLENLRKRLASLEAESRAAGDERDRAQAELDAARQEVSTLRERLEQAEADPPSTTGGTGVARRGARGQRARSR
jgi:chromosome segregation ATPase